MFYLMTHSTHFIYSYIVTDKEGRKEGNVLFNEVTDKEGRKEMFYLMMHSTHFIYGYVASDKW